MVELNFTLKAAGAGGGDMSAEDRKKAEAKNAAIKTAFGEGVTLSNAGKNDEAIAKFNEVLVIVPKCVECYTNIGANYAQKKEWDKAEASYKKAIEVDPNSADAYNGLANVYNAQKKFDQAAEASAQAMKLRRRGRRVPAARPAAASASAMFNQGVILWNAGKIADAKKQFEEAVKLDPKLADAHYWLGMANLNEGKTAEGAIPHFDEYLKLAPTGQYAEQAKGILATHQEVAPFGVHRRQPSRTSRPGLLPPRSGPGATPPPSPSSPSPRHSRSTPSARPLPPASVMFGENRVQEALQKIAAAADNQMSWHLIGHLQSNKATQGGAGVRRASSRSIRSTSCASSTKARRIGRRRPAAGAAGPGRSRGRGRRNSARRQTRRNGCVRLRPRSRTRA